MPELDTICKGLVIIALLNIICSLRGAEAGSVNRRQDKESLIELPTGVEIEDDEALQVNEGDLAVVMENGMPLPANKERLDKMEHRLEALYGKMEHKGDKEAKRLEIEKEYDEFESAVTGQKGRENGENFHVSEKLKKFLIEIGSPLIKFIGDANMMDERDNKKKRTIFTHEGRVWTKGIIPYLFKDDLRRSNNKRGLSGAEEARSFDNVYYYLKRADSWKAAAIRYMKEWEAVTAYRFVPYTPTVHAKYGLDHNTTLQFVKGDGCWSLEGKISSMIQNISPCGGAAATHEIGHALGLVHEQQNVNRDTHIRINWDNIKPEYKNVFALRTGRNTYSFDYYDLSSFMHYGLGDFNSNGQRVMTILDNRLEYLVHEKYNTDYFYPAYEVQLALKLNETICKNFTLKCQNAGYLSYVNGKCQCRCPFALNPADGCQTLESNGREFKMFGEGCIFSKLCQDLSWPKDYFAFLKPLQGCPHGFKSGSVKRHKEHNGLVTVTSNFHGAGEYTNLTNVKEEFCVKDKTFTGSQANPAQWSPGNYCILRKGGMCPQGFEAGSIQFDDHEAHGNTTILGDIPDGTFLNRTKFEFCCRNDGAHVTPIELPKSVPFTLYVGSSGSCQEVKGMGFFKESYNIYNTANSSLTSRTNSTPYLDGYSDRSSRRWIIFFCFYYPVNYGCGGIYKVSTGNPLIVTSPNYPQNYDNSKRCTWVLKSPEGTKLRLNFDKMDIKTTSDGSCEDMLEIRHTLPGHRGFKICGNGYRETIITETSYLILTLFTDFSNAATGFNATVDVISNNMLNYVNQGLEGAYSGKVSVTRNFDVCLPWADATGKCPHHPMQSSDIADNLEENYCRNPGTGSRPWCYTAVDQCVRDYCDVSFLERCIDEWTDCAELLSLESDFCTVYAKGDAWKCSKTCGKCKTRGPVIPATSVICRPPSELKDGDYNPKKSSYAVGETVKYTCTKGSDEINITCTSEGSWVPKVTFVCGVPKEKGDGWTIFQGHFYKFFDIGKTIEEADAYCSSLKASVSTAKTKEENDYIGSVAPWGKSIWIGITDAEKEGVWKWNDGTLVTWINWNDGQPDDLHNEDHAIMRYGDNKWNDVKNSSKNTFVCKREFEKRKVCADQDSSCMNLIAKIPDMRFKYPSFAWERCPKTTGLCTDADVTGQKPCNSSTLSAACAVCLNPGAVEHATKVKGGDKITVGELFEYTCNAGYTLAKGDLIRACLLSRTLTGETPVCKDIQLVPTKVNNVSTRKRNNVMSQKTVYTGDNAYHRISKSGEIYEWEFYSHVNGKIALQVWRRKEMSFTLVGQNIVDQARDDRLRRIIVPSGRRIAVKPNDLIGFYYVGVSKGGVTFDGCRDNVEPEGRNLFYSSSIYPDATSFSVNQTITFKAETSCRVFSLNALVGPKL